MSNSGNILLPILALIVMSLSVAGLWLWWQMSKEKNAEDGDPSDKDQYPVATAGPTSTPAKPNLLPASKNENKPSTFADTNSVEVMRVYRDLADGSLFVQIDGQYYRSLGDFKDAENGRRFIGNTKALATFAKLEKFGGNIPLPPIPTPPPAPTKAPEQNTLPKVPALDQVKKKKGKPSEDDEVIEIVPIIDQIEALLQTRLSESPTLRYRSLHIIGTPLGVRIEVDGRFFDGVDEIDDAEAKEFIQKTTREWESRN